MRRCPNTSRAGAHRREDANAGQRERKRRQARKDDGVVRCSERRMDTAKNPGDVLLFGRRTGFATRQSCTTLFPAIETDVPIVIMSAPTRPSEERCPQRRRGVRQARQRPERHACASVMRVR